MNFKLALIFAVLASMYSVDAVRDNDPQADFEEVPTSSLSQSAPVARNPRNSMPLRPKDENLAVIDEEGDDQQRRHPGKVNFGTANRSMSNQRRSKAYYEDEEVAPRYKEEKKKWGTGKKVAVAAGLGLLGAGIYGAVKNSRQNNANVVQPAAPAPMMPAPPMPAPQQPATPQAFPGAPRSDMNVIPGNGTAVKDPVSGQTITFN